MSAGVVALDFSLRSPGLCAVLPTGQVYLAGFYCNTPQKRVFAATGTAPQVQIQLFRTLATQPHVADRAFADLQRYDSLLTAVLGWLENIFPDRDARAQVQVLIEGYAFYGRGNTGSNYKLHEVTGCCKLLMYRAGFVKWREVTARAWRSVCFSKRGTIDKKDALDFFNARLPHVPVMEVCKRTLGKNGSVPCPAQDLCESFCIAMALPGLVPPKSNAPKKKRGRSTEAAGNGSKSHKIG